MSRAPVAVVTGGRGGIGRAIGAALARDGHVVVALDRAAPAPADAGDTTPAVDLADAAEVHRAARAVLAVHGRCDVLVHAAADMGVGGLADVTLEGWRRAQAVTVESVLLLTQAFAPGMAARGHGRIVIIGSDTLFAPPGPGLLAYVTTKGALAGLARALAVELGPDGIAVTTVAPGLTDTPTARAGMGDAAFDDVLARQLLPRTLRPDDVAETVAFLAGDRAAALAGQTLCVDGGRVLR